MLVAGIRTKKGAAAELDEVLRDYIPADIRALERLRATVRKDKKLQYEALSDWIDHERTVLENYAKGLMPGHSMPTKNKNPPGTVKFWADRRVNLSDSLPGCP